MLFGVAVPIYAAAITWGLPHATSHLLFRPWGTDELAPLGPLAQVYHVVLGGEARFDPRYPLLPYLIQSATIAPYLLWLKVTGGLAGFSAEFPHGLADPVSSLAAMTLAARVSSLLMAAALPAIAFHTVGTFRDRRTAALAGVFVLLIYSLAYYARTSNVDTASLFWTALGILVFASSLRDGLTGRRAAVLGVFAALAIASKDQNYVIFAALGVAIIVLHLHRLRTTGARAALAAPAIGLATAAAVYLVGSGLVFRPDAFVRHVSFITGPPGPASGRDYFSGAATPEGYARLLVEYGRQILDSVGLPMAVAAAAGIVVAAREHPRLLLLGIPVIAVFAGVIVPVRFVRIRFVLPAAYTLALFAAVGVGALLRRQEGHGPPSRMRTRLAWACICIVAGWSLLRIADLTYQMRHDVRYALGDWIEANARSGDRIGFYGGHAKLPPLPPGIVPQTGPFALAFDDPPPADLPEFVLLIPQQPFETEHEWTLPEERYRELVSGAAGYQLWIAAQGPSLFRRRPINWVNPPVRLLVRRDVLPRLRHPAPRIEL